MFILQKKIRFDVVWCAKSDLNFDRIDKHLFTNIFINVLICLLAI